MIVFVLFVILLVALVKYWYSYWTRKGFPSLKNAIPFGVLGPVVAQRQSFGEAVGDVYLRRTEPYLGIFFLFRPVLLIRDAGLIKRILITDFDHFTDRGLHFDELHDPVGANLVVMPGEKWRNLRAKLSPTFSSSKLKIMFQTIEEKVHLLEDHLDAVGSEVRLKEPVSYLVTSILAAISFGFELNAFENPEHDFVKMAPNLLNPQSFKDKMRLSCTFLLPNLMTWLQMSLMSPEVNQCALSIVRSIVEMRKSDPSTIRNDFMQAMIEMMDENQKDGSEPMTIESCAAQAFAFYAAGMDTTANTISYCIHELSKCPEWMAKVQSEVDTLMQKRCGRIQYEDLMEMRNLNLCITETLRFYPGLPMLSRDCTKEYRIPGTEHIIRKGEHVVIPLMGLHMDEQFYPNPKKFDPSRYEGTSTEDMPYYPMGAGGRYCIGARLGLMDVGVVLCRLLYRYEFEAVNEKIEIKPTDVTITDKNGVHMRIKRRI